MNFIIHKKIQKFIEILQKIHFLPFKKREKLKFQSISKSNIGKFETN